MKRLIALVLTLGLFAACQDNPTGTSTADAPDIQTSTAMAVKPEVYWYFNRVDKLRLRAEPHQGGAILAEIPEAEIVEGTGERSSNVEEIALRNIPYRSPYFRVSTPGNAPKSGWAFGGALLPLYAGARAQSPDPAVLAQFSGFFKNLNTKQLESGKKAWDYVQQQTAKAPAGTAEAAFIFLESFMTRLEMEGEFYKMTENLPWTDADYEAIYQGKFDPAKNPVTQKLADNGFRIQTAEGMVFPDVDWRKFQRYFSGKVGPVMKAYIDQRTAEQNEPMYDDGGIIIPLEQVADRAAFWEKFNRDNPYFVRIDETRESQNWLTMVLINGADNTPMFDYETNAVSDDFKKLWDYILQKYPGTELALAVKEMAELCASEGWKRTKKVEALQTKRLEMQ